MDLTLREILDRYGPTIAVIVALVLLVALFPSQNKPEDFQSITTVDTAVDGSGEVADAGAGATDVKGGSTIAAGGPKEAKGGSGVVASAPDAVGAVEKKICRKEDGRQLAIS